VKIWNKEPLMCFEICLWEQSHIYMQVLQLFIVLRAPSPNAICIEYHNFEWPINSNSHSVSLSQVPFLQWPLFCLFLTQLHWAVLICCTMLAIFSVILLVELAACTNRPVHWISCCGSCCYIVSRKLFPNVYSACGCWCCVSWHSAAA
jgi:hypothetical protein